MRPAIPLLVLVCTAALAGAGFFLWSIDAGGPKQQTVEREGAASRVLRPTTSEPSLAATEPEQSEPRSEARPAATRHSAAASKPAAPELAAPADPFVRGRVVDEWGKPLAGTQVVCYALPPQVAEMPGMAAFAGNLRRSGKKEEAQTGEDGTFEVEVPARDRELELELLLRGYELATIQVGRPSELPVELGELTLSAGCVIRGRVAGGNGRPVHGARVSIEHEGDEDLMGLAAMGFDVATGPRTGKDGVFEFPHEPAGEFRIQATHRERPTRAIEGKARVGEVLELVLELPEGGRITGRVEGVPEDVRGLIVQARRVGGPVPEGEPDGEDGGSLGAVFSEMGMSTGEHWAKVRDGEFEFEGLETSGTYAVWAAAPHRQMFLREACSSELEVPVGQRDVVLVYELGASVAFQVIDAASRQPVTEFEVISRLGRSDNLPARRDEVSDREGRAVLTNLRPRSDGEILRFAVRAVGYRTHQERVAIQLQGELSLGRVFLHAEPVLRVTVRDAALGRPVAGASVLLAVAGEELPEWGMRRGFGSMSFDSLDDDSSEDRSPRRGETDEEGRCTLTSMPGTKASLTVRADELALHRETRELPATGDVELEVVLATGGALSVTVLDDDELPAARARVEHRPPDSREREQHSYPTDDLGRLEVDHLVPGTHLLRAKPRRDLPFGGRMQDDHEAAGEWVEALVVEGETTEVTLSLPDFGALFGRVTQAGRPLPGATLALLRDEGGEGQDVVLEGMERWLALANATTDERGAYQLRSLPAGSYHLRVRHRDRVMPTTLSVEVSEGESELDIELETNLVRGRVRKPDGKGLAGAEVSAMPAADLGKARLGMSWFFGRGGTVGRDALTDERGNYELSGLAAGEKIVVRVQAAGYSPAHSDPLTLEDGERRDDVDVVLEPAGKLTVRIEGGRPFLRVRAMRISGGEGAKLDPRADGEPEAGTTARRAAIARRGQVIFDDLEPGTWTVEIEDEERGRLEIAAGESHTLDVLLEAED